MAADGSLFDETPSDKAARLQTILIARATGGVADDGANAELRPSWRSISRGPWHRSLWRLGWRPR